MITVSVCHAAQLSFTAKTAERIKMLLGVNTPECPWNGVLDKDAEGKKGKMVKSI